VLVTGPTGSGKSTTLASLINEINETRDEHIITIEDPIEFLHSAQECIVNQRELAPTPELRARPQGRPAARIPDVILVGEMRDMRRSAPRSPRAETGHLVFATLHTQDAPQTVDRIIDVFPSNQQGSGPHAAVGLAAGHRDPDARAHRRRPGRCVAARSSSRRPASGT
jgi:twitching motility protein PilT